MKKIMKKFTAFICVLSLVFGSIAITPVINAEAEEAGFQMRAGASVRISTDTGIRFAVEISSPVREELFTEDGETRTLKENVEIGMIIVPKRVIDGATGDYFNYFSTNYGKSKEQISAQFTAGQFKVDGEKLYATAAIVNIKDKNFVQEYQAVAYYTTDGGATYTYTAKSDARTIGYVADRALADTTDYSSASSKTVGYLLEKYIKLSKANDLTLTKNPGDSLNLFNEFAAGLENTSQFAFALKHSSSNVTVKDSTLKVKNEGYATVTMKGYDELVDLEIPVNVVAENSAPVTGTKVYYSGANGNVYADVLTSDMIGVENGTSLTIGGKTAAIKASIDITEDIYTENSVYTAYLKLGVSKVQIQRWIEEGYTEFVIPYYLSDASTAGTAIYNLDLTVNVAATKNEWSELRYPLQWVYDNYDKIQEATGENFFLRILIKSSGTYEFYLGECEVFKQKTTVDLDTDAKVSGTGFDGWSGNSSTWIGSNGSYAERLTVATVDGFQGQPAILHATINHKADGSSSNFAENSLDMFYTCQSTLGVTKEEVQEWIDAGYTKLQFSYYLIGEGDVTLWASYEGVYNGSWDQYLNVVAEKDKWATFEIALSDILIQFDYSSGYLFRIAPQSEGTYEFYLGSAKGIRDNELDTDAYLTGTGMEGWSNAGNTWTGSGDGTGRLTLQSVSSYEGQPALVQAVINHKDDTTSDMFYTSYATLGVTAEQVQAWMDAGYINLSVSYYLNGTGDVTIWGGYEGYNNNWGRYFEVTAEKGRWTTFEIPLEHILVQLSDNPYSDYLFRLSPQAAGTYEFYLGGAEATNNESNIDATVLESISSYYASVNGERAFVIEEDQTLNDVEAQYKISGEVTSDYYAKGGAISVYANLGVTKSVIKEWIDAGYEQLKLTYYLDTDSECAVSLYAMDKNELNTQVVKNAWSECYLDLLYIHDYYEQIQEGVGDNYLLRIEPQEAGIYAFYIGNCEPVQDTLVNLSGSFYYYNVGDGSGRDVSVETQQSDAEKALDLIVDDKMAEWKAGPVTLTSSDVHGDGYFHVFLNLDFTKEQLQAWIDSGATHIRIPYYIKTDVSDSLTVAEGMSWELWQGNIKKNEWTYCDLSLSAINSKYDVIQAGTDSWSTLLFYGCPTGTYEFYFGESEIVTSEDTTNTQVITKGNGLSFWWYGTSEHYGSATITEDVEIDGKNADIQATITISDSDFNNGMNLSAYYKFGIEKEQIQSWIDEGYTELTIPYYLKVENGGAVSTIWADYDDSEEDASLAWTRYLNVTPVTDTWSSFTIDLDDLLLRYDNVQKATGEGYLFRLTPTAAGTYTLYTGAAGVYCEETVATITESTHVKEMTATSNTIVTSGASDYEILIPSDASEELHTAAEELQFFLKEATGVELPIISQAKTDGKYFSLGNTRLAKQQGLEGDEEVLGTEGYQIKTVDNNVYIYAADDTGVLYGVYGYLELALNYDFFFTDVYTIDNVDTLALHNFNVTDVPDIENRIASYGFQTMDETTRMRMRMSNYVETLTGVDGSAFHNSFDYLPKETYQTKYPNWYSEDDTQLCYTAHGNAEELAKMQEIIANAMYKTLVSQKYEDYHQIVLALEDETGWCTCDACAKTKSSYGADSASVILFYNEVAELLEAKLRMVGDERAETFKLIFYAYYAIEDAPVTVSTNENGETVYRYRPEMKLNYHVSPMYAPIYADFSKPFTAETNKQYLETMQKWNAISESMHMWGYDSFFNNRGYLLPYNSWDSLDDLYKVAYENGVDWMFLQGQTNNVASSGFTLLKGYLQSKLSWDVNADVEALTDKFFDAMYGAQADTVQGVYESIKTHMDGLSADNFWPQVNSDDRNNDGHFDSSNWPETTLKNWYSTLEAAENALTAAGDTEGAKRIRLEEANILSLLLETHYVMIDSTSDTWRTYNTLKSGFSDYRNKFGDIVTEWNIENAAENDWTIATYLEMLGYSN